MAASIVARVPHLRVWVPTGPLAIVDAPVWHVVYIPVTADAADPKIAFIGHKLIFGCHKLIFV
jgi:hypothetical protein